MPISDILSLTKAALPAVETLLARATENLRKDVLENGRISSAKLEMHQDAAHALSWLATYTMALRQMSAWA
ncbi:MAG: acyl-CoA dehydrogenase, partial [Marinosulfonomonas sp.]|nr:acyl-CoA dehydrogenase [Marinosulfonomonas sp.]